MAKIQYSQFDRLIMAFDQQVLSTLAGSSTGNRDYPAENITDSRLPDAARKTIEGFMRVNHAGEVSAQALYLGQACVAKDQDVKSSMQESAEEERDHLQWCRKRLEELNGRTSYLDPLWYLGSFSIGAIAGLMGDKWSLGFIEETEKQVVEHLQSHLDELPIEDKRTIAILTQMKQDEAHHRDKAAESGAAELPEPIKLLMNLASKIMTKTAFWI